VLFLTDVLMMGLRGLTRLSSLDHDCVRGIGFDYPAFNASDAIGQRIAHFVNPKSNHIPAHLDEPQVS